MKIANIVSTHSVNVSKAFNIVGSMDEIIHGIPTLILGFSYVNNNYPDFDILERKLGENLYWTFKKTERRDKYEEDLRWFVNLVVSQLFDKISYVFVDVIQFSDITIKKIVKKFFNMENKISYQNGQMIYIYAENIILGIDLKLLRFVGINVSKIKNKIKAKSSVFFTDDTIFIEDKTNITGLENNVRYTPFLFSITNNEENNPTSIIHKSR
jgi:hypothetical protein